MHASKKISLTFLLWFCTIATILAAPGAFAKKDLFANDPAASNTSQAQSYVTASVAAINPKTEAPKAQTAAPVPVERKAIPAESKPSYLTAQMTRLKGHLVEAKEDLFGSKKSSKKITPDSKAVTEKEQASEENSSEEARLELPVISATEAAQRAQTFAEGQVINVRQYQDEGNQRYAVKLLQKNGRMKTVNLNAVNGDLIEETTE
jgi:uncharacterized membrane protein YkoI